MTDVALVPSAPVLLPAYAGMVDPVPRLRAAAVAAVAWLVSRWPEQVVVLGAAADAGNVARGVVEPAGMRVAHTLLAAARFRGVTVEAPQPGPIPSIAGAGLLVAANGSARRGEKAPGHLDERAAGFDAAVDRALRTCDRAALVALDERLGAELLAPDVPALRALGSCVTGDCVASIDLVEEPYGVCYWVARWACDS